MGVVIGAPNGLRTEPGTGSIGGSAIERRTQDHHIGLSEAGRVLEIGLRDAEEGEVGSEEVADAAHWRNSGRVCTGFTLNRSKH